MCWILCDCFCERLTLFVFDRLFNSAQKYNWEEKESGNIWKVYRGEFGREKISLVHPYVEQQLRLTFEFKSLELELQH